MARKTSAKTDKAAVLTGALKGMFRKLEGRPVPDHIRVVVEQLEPAADAAPIEKRG